MAKQHVKDLKVNAQELAAICGVHGNTVAVWLANGLAHDRDGNTAVIRVIDGVHWFKRSLDADLKNLRERLEGVDSKERKTAAEARLAEMKVQQAEGKLVPLDGATRQWTHVVTSFREHLLAVAGAAVQAGLVEPARELELDGMLRDALALLARGFTQSAEEAEQAEPLASDTPQGDVVSEAPEAL